MPREEFERIVGEEFPDAIPEKFRSKIKNVAFLIEDEPSPQVRRAEHLRSNETLLGYYRGIPHTARGDGYGVGTTLPDTITLYQLPIEELAQELYRSQEAAEGSKAWPTLPAGRQGGPERTLLQFANDYPAYVRKVVRDTIWHEVAHHFGMDEHEVRTRERKRRGHTS